ncbi:Late embryogenesis abundant protein LEA-2 subgroup domain-containing protein [Dioscorea alata]|uniref:Late embryogenesis abundant protein LEA-2 subgroup domain-containing protein n=1 Tax=Dioscorea alata TaxID=55571 RepID=A0ACB7VSW4_DIOAL|nr:Late embryogenesis abundant protein LEA-2 subgroup domain-containing protein [Dioscorea alata]
MADRVHPDPPSGDAPPPPPPLSNPPEKKSRPRSGTYVIQIPKDQIYRVPPPENATLYEYYTSRATSHRRRSIILTSILSILFLLSILTAITGLLYLFLRPRLPSLSADRLTFLNITSPEIDAILRASNQNDKIGFRYLSGGSLTVSYSGVPLALSPWPEFKQVPGNITVLETTLTGDGFRPTDPIQKALEAELRQGEVLLGMKMTAPVKFFAASLTTWTFTVRVWCDVVVDRLTADARIISQECNTALNF